jgi:adenosylcobinamide kinase/adenosylcobinamide-phosphate guanylyltransferase
MRVQLLGTGSADGWPNPWCDCPSCADQRDRGLVRTPTSALVDGRLLLDCGPEAPRQADRFGVDLRGIEVVLLGHAHHDHLDPSFLLYRGWATDRPLTVVGPGPAIAQCRAWLDPGDTTVRLVEVTAGVSVEVAGLGLQVLPAAHEAFGEAVLYLVGDGRSRLLYATDTGPLPEATLAALAGAALDLLLLEETFGHWTGHATQHHDLPAFAATLGALRAVGAVGPGTDVVAVHLSHHNPPLPALAAALAGWGARCVPDGTVLELGGS